MEKHHKHLPDFVKSKKKVVAAHERHFEKYGKLVAYDKYTGEFRDFKSEWKNTEKGKTLLSHARKCNCECQVELTLLNLAHTMQNVAIIKQRIEDVLPENMFYYLTANFMQHRMSWNDSTPTTRLEEIYAKRARDVETKASDSFDELLKKLVEVPCFRRFLASIAKGDTLIKILDLCLCKSMTDIDYVDILMKMPILTEERNDLLVRLRKCPVFYVNRVFKLSPHLGFGTLHDWLKITGVTRYGEKLDLLSPRHGRICLPWNCKRVLLIAIMKRDRGSPFSKIPKDIFNIVIGYTETIALPSAKSFKYEEPVDSQRKDKKESCTLM
jgi:hypothetical protein